MISKKFISLFLFSLAFTSAAAPKVPLSRQLYDAAYTGNYQTLTQLVTQHPTAVHTRYSDGETLLHVAAWQACKKSNPWANYIECIMFLVNRGADINAADKAGWTALHYAAQLGHVDDVVILLKLNANVHAQTFDHSTPLHVAAANGYAVCVELLVEHGGAHINVKNTNMETPASIAQLTGHHEIAGYLLLKIAPPPLEASAAA